MCHIPQVLENAVACCLLVCWVHSSCYVQLASHVGVEHVVFGDLTEVTVTAGVSAAPGSVVSSFKDVGFVFSRVR